MSVGDSQAAGAGPGPAIDLDRMRRERIAKLNAAMEACAVDRLMLRTSGNVSYATGVRFPAADQARAMLRRPVAVLERGAEWPLLYTPFESPWPAEFRLAEEPVPHGGVALDDVQFSQWDSEFQDALPVLALAKLTKTPDELACIGTAQAINEAAMKVVRARAVPGVSTIELSGLFQRTVAELGADSNTLDPVFQVMPKRLADGPFSVTGEPVFPIPTNNEILAAGDVVWTDTGINLHGYASDFGSTWFIGDGPGAAQAEQFARWRSIVDRALAAIRPGATGADLVAAAAGDGPRPWLSYFYLAHGLGTESVERPLLGTDLGAEFDASVVLAPGMVLVFEPVIWDDGDGGFRSEDVVAVTDDGYAPLSTPSALDTGA